MYTYIVLVLNGFKSINFHSRPLQQQPQQQLRQQFQQPLNSEILTQQQLLKQQQLLHLQQQQQQLQQQQQALNLNSPKRMISDGILGNRQIITQSVVHQNYGIAPQQQQQQQQSSNNQQQSPSNQQQTQLRQTQRGLPVAVTQPVVCLQMPYYAQPPQQTYFGDMLHQMQVCLI